MTKTRLLAIAVLSTAAAVAGCTALQAYVAPKFANEGVHAGAKEMSESECLSCHLAGKDGAPVAPESMYSRKNCWRCHLR